MTPSAPSSQPAWFWDSVCEPSARTAEHVADSVDRRFKPRVRETSDEPAARLDVLRRKRRPVHAALVSAELGEAAQVGEQSATIDLRHCAG
jgi:hypothetical protein